MSEQPNELRICPHCGQENAAYTLRCIRCGQELEELFELEGFEPTISPEDEESENATAPMSEILASLNSNPLLAETENAEDDAREREEEQPDSGRLSPDWLERIRQRAKEEEDAAGELAKGAIAMDDRRSQEGRKQVDEAFDEIMRRIREQNEREKARTTRRVESDLVDDNGDPEWLRRIRALHPDRDDDAKGIIVSSGVKDPNDDEWTEEELQELLRRELGLPEKPENELEEEITTEVSTPFSVEEETEVPSSYQAHEVSDVESEPEFIHNIPEDEEVGFVNEVENDAPADNSESLELTEAPIQPEGGLEAEPDSESAETQAEDETEKAFEAKAPEAPAKNPPSAEEPLSTAEILPDLLLLKNQRERAQVFIEIIGQEGRRTIAVLHETSRQSKIGRLVLGLLLILGVLLAVLIGPSGTIDLPLSAPAVTFAKNLESIASADDVLIVLDYQAASRNDIEPLAERTLTILQENGSELRIVTSNPENLWLAANSLEPVQLPDEFVPGGMLGYLALSVGDSPDWGELPINQAFSGSSDLFGGVEQVLLISDSAEFVRMWLEQIDPWHPKIKTSAITTAVSAPVLLPYYDSGQLKGVVAGLADAKALDVEPQNLVNQRAYQVGMLLMIVVLILGMITKADEDTLRRSEERKQ